MDLEWEGLEDDDENQNQDFEENVFNLGRDALIFLIDATSPMFIKYSDDESAFNQSMKCVRTHISNKIISDTKDLVGVVFFGTEKNKNESDFKNVYISQSLDLPSAAAVLAAEELIDISDDQFQKEYGHSNDFSFSDALWCCGMLFNSCSIKLASKKIIVFTNTDNPHSGKGSLDKLARDKATDLMDHNIVIDLISLLNPNQDFNPERFFKEIVSNTSDLVAPSQGSSNTEDLMERIRVKEFKKRAITSLKLNLGEDCDLSVQVFALVREVYKPLSVGLEKASNTEVKRMTKEYLKDTAEIILPVDFIKYQEFAKEKVYMTQDDVKQVKSIYNQGLQLLGFKPMSLLKQHHFIKPCLFVFPNEKFIMGSTKLFSALLDRCIENQVVMICQYTPRLYSPPQLVALYPQGEEDPSVPSGFHLMFLPFADDFRSIKCEEKVQPSTSLTNKAKEIINKLKFKFDSKNFENPVLQNHWRNIEALALNSTAPDEMIDYSLPDYEQVNKKAGSLITKFANEAFPNGLDLKATAVKRKAVAVKENEGKRVKSECDLDAETLARSKQLSKLTVVQLKDICRNLDIKGGGTKKMDLIDSIYKHFKVD